MGFLAAVMVVGIHVTGDVPHEHPLWLWVQWGRLGVFRLTVPFFFLVSGFMLAGHFHENGWWRSECKKRIRSLLIPFLLWSTACVITWFLMVAFANVLQGGEHMPEMSWGLMATAYGLNPFCFPLLGPLWYVRTLMIFVLISPLISFALRLFGWKIVLGLYVFSGINAYVASGYWQLFSTYTFSIGGLGYFTLGAWIRSNDWTVESCGKILSLVAFVLGLVLIALDIYLVPERTANNLSAIGFRMAYVPLLMFATYNLMPSIPLPRWMVSCAFPIFLMHVLVWRWLNMGLGHVLTPVLSPNSGVAWVLKWLLGVCVPIGMAVLLRLFTPRLARLLFGGR